MKKSVDLKEKLEVSVEKLHRQIKVVITKPAKKNTKDFIGQKKARESLKFGLEMKEKGYNIFVTGLSHSGRNSMVEKYIREFVKKTTEKKSADNLKDIVCVYNFENVDAPIILIFRKGEAKKFKKAERI